MAAVDMSYVDIYNPKPAPKVSRSQPTRSVLNKHRPPLQPIKSPLAASRQNGQDNESSDDPFQSFDELFRYPNSRDAHQGSPQNHEPLHGSKHQLFDEGSLSIDLTISGLVYVLGSAEEEPLIIEDGSEEGCEDEPDAGTAPSDLDANIENQDASECGLTTQDTASTPSSPLSPFTPQASEYPDPDYLSKDGQRAYFEESDWTISVQGRPTMDEDQIHEGIADAVVDEIGSPHCNSLLKRAAGSCGQDSAYDIEDKIQHVQALEEAENSTLPNYPDPPLNSIR